MVARQWTGRCADEATIWPLADAAAELPGVNLRLGVTVASVDAKRAVLTTGEILDCDHLVLSPGVISDPSFAVGDAAAVSGLTDHSLDLYSHSSLPAQKEQLGAMVAGLKAGNEATLLIPIVAVPYKCPVAPFEVQVAHHESITRMRMTYKQHLQTSPHVHFVHVAGGLPRRRTPALRRGPRARAHRRHCAGAVAAPRSGEAGV